MARPWKTLAVTAVAESSRADISWVLNASTPASDRVEGFTDAWTLMAVAAGLVATLAPALGRMGVRAERAAPAEASA